MRQLFQDWLFAPLGMHDWLQPDSPSSALPAPSPRSYMYGPTWKRWTEAGRLIWVDTGPRAQYGLRTFPVNGFLGHDGELPGFQSFLGYDPDQQLTIILLVNLTTTADGQTPADTLAGIAASYLRETVLAIQ